MAVTNFISPPMIIQKSASSSTRRPASIVMMSADNHMSVNTTPFLIRLPSRNKVFEDQSNGIVCYRQENGEIICEGFDEGPRFHRPLSRFASNPRDAEIADLLNRSWLQVVGGGKLK